MTKDQVKVTRGMEKWATMVWICLGAGCFGDLPEVPELSGAGTNGTGFTVSCPELSVTAMGATLAFSATVGGLPSGHVYEYSADGLPAGLSIDPESGEMSGTVMGEPGSYWFDVSLTEAGGGMTTATCELVVRGHLTATLDVNTIPYCLGFEDSLLDYVVSGTGDDTPIACDFPGGVGNGRMPTGITVDSQTCTLTGTVDEERLGTWVFMMRGIQSGAEVYVPFCVTNDEVSQEYDIVGTHSGISDATLEPITRVYDPSEPFDIGTHGDPRYEVSSSGVCGASCFYNNSWLRTNAPISAEGGFTLKPDGLLDNGSGDPMGFFHELHVSGSAVPSEFRERPWVLSIAVTYCMSGDPGDCYDVGANAGGALEIGLIMVPN